MKKAELFLLELGIGKDCIEGIRIVNETGNSYMIAELMQKYADTSKPLCFNCNQEIEDEEEIRCTECSEYE